MVRRVRRPLLALIVLLLAVGVGYAVKAWDPGSKPPHLRTVPLSSLPAQAAQTLALIDRGGRLPYPRDDGVVFHNDEGHLPKKPDGYYHEYTVPTPGLASRGARRLVLARDGTVYYTGDHYTSFVIVDVRR